MREIYIPETKEEACRLKAERPEAKYIAGGTELLRLGSPFKDEGDLIDLNKLPLKSVSVKKGKLVIGSLVTFQALTESPLTPLALKESALFLASRARRNASTVGGNLAARRSDSFLAPFFLAAEAILEVMEEGKVTVLPLKDYKDGLILSVSFDPAKPILVKRISRTAQSHAAVTIAVGKDTLGLAVKGGGLFTRLEDVKYASDLTGGAEYKEYIVKTLYEELGEALND